MVDSSGNETLTQYSLVEKRPVVSLGAENTKTTYKYEIKHNDEYVDVTNLKDSDELYEKYKEIIKDQHPVRETMTDTNNQTTVVEKDDRGNTTKKTNPDGSCTVYTYDADNNILTEKLYDNDKKVLSDIKYTYNESGFLVSVEYGSSGSKEELKYDENSKVKGLVAVKTTSRNSSSSVKTEYTYYDNGQLKSEKTGDRVTYYAYSYGTFEEDRKVELNGKTAVIEKPNNDYEKCIFYVQTKLNPEGSFEISYHDRYFNTVKTTLADADGKEKSTSLVVYDEFNRKIKEVSPEVYAKNPETADKLAKSCHTYKYSNLGLLTEKTDAEGNITAYKYDASGNLVEQTDPGSAVYSYKYDGLNRLVSKSFSDGHTSADLELFSYENGGKDAPSDKASKQTHTEYINGENEFVTETWFDYAGRETVSVTPYKRVEKEYYCDGNLKRERTFETSGESKCVSDNIYFYNDRGLLDITLTGYKPGKSYFISKNLYTLDGLIEYQINYLNAVEVTTDSPVLPEKARASVIKYEYDESGNILKENTLLDNFSVSEISSAVFAVKTEYEYDIPNNTVTEKSGNIETVYVNNYLGRTVIVKNIADKDDIVSGTADENGKITLITTNTYDKNGNLIRTVTPSGSETEYSYDNLNRLTETRRLDVLSEDGTEGTLTESLSYNWAGSVTEKILRFNDEIKSESEYSYDSRNNLTLSVDKVGGKDAATAYEYNNAGLLISEAGPSAFEDIKADEEYTVSNASSHINYIYDSAGRLKAKEFCGKTYVFNAEKEEMTAVDDEKFVVSAYEYDANDNVIKEVDGEEYAAAQNVSEAKGKTYTYSGTGSVLSERTPVCDQNFSALYEYDAIGNTVSEKILKGTEDSKKYEITATEYVQNSEGVIQYTSKTSEIAPDEEASAEKLLSVKTWKTDINGNIIEESVGRNKTKTEYNSLGFEKKSVTEVDRYTENDKENIVNNEIRTIYDNEGNAVLIIRNSGIVEINEYDNLKRLVSKTTGRRPAGTADADITADKLTDSVTQKWAYDIHGNVRFQYDGNGFKTEYRYDELSRLMNTVKKYGSDKISEEKNTYDLSGNLTEKISLLNGKQTAKETYIYDGLGRVIQKSDADVAYEYIEYNKNSDQIKSYDAEKVLKQFEYDANRQLVKTVFDGICTEELTCDYAGNVCSKTDGEGNKTLYHYDAMDRLVKVLSEKSADSAEEAASYTYDTEGNIATKKTGSKNKITYTYTASGNVKETNSNGKTDSFYYNSDGQLEKAIDPAGNETVYTYTAQGLTAKEEVKADGKVAVIRTYTYDKNGNVLKSSVTENGRTNVITRTYDELGRVTKKEATDSVTSEFIYDEFTADNMLCEITRYSNGESSANVYDEFGRLKYVYASDISAGADDSGKTEYIYDTKGRRVSIIYPNGSKSTYEYYDNNNVKTLINYVRDNDSESEDEYKEIEKYEYSYFNNNTMSEKKEAYDGVQRTTSYEYDELLRLVSTKEIRNEKENRNITYSYDDSGNRIKEESIEEGVKSTKTYSYGEGNLLLGYTVITGSEKTDEVKYEYDANGNLTKESVLLENGFEYSKKDTLNTYNALNQLVSTKTSDLTVINEYNAEGLRISKEVKPDGVDKGTKTNYTYEYDNVIFETTSDKYIRNVQGINLISRQIDGEMFYCLYNGHADITRMVDESGELAEKYYYDEWGVETESLKYGDLTGDGNVNINDYSLLKRHIYFKEQELSTEQKIVSDLNGDGKTDTEDLNILKQIISAEIKSCPADTNMDGFINEKNNIKYAGYFYDGETGLYYLNARFYDPETARFIQEDTYSGDILDPLSLNLYTYGHNNPISYYDPTGHSIKSVLKKAVNTVKSAVNTVKAVATVAKPYVKDTVKMTTAIATSSAAIVTSSEIKNLVSSPAVKKVISSAANVLKKVQEKTVAERTAFQAVVALGQTEEAGQFMNCLASFSQGEIDTVQNQINGIYQLSSDPDRTIDTAVWNFYSDPLRNNPIAGIVGYYKDVANASYVHDWKTVSYKLGEGAINLSEFYVGAKLTTVKVPKVNVPAAINGIPNAISNFGTPALAEANGMVISSVEVSAEASVAASTVSAASGIRAAVGAAVAGGNVYYSGKGYGQSNGVVASNGSSSKSSNTNAVNSVPSIKGGAFNKWFNSLSVDELDALWENKATRKAIEGRLRSPGGMHEWHLVSRAPQFKNWGVSAEQIRGLRTAINDVEFVNPTGSHGQLGSTLAHNELLGIIDSSIDYDMFKRRLNNWSNYRLNGGVDSLPEGLRMK